MLIKVRSTICDHRMDGNELVHKEVRFVTLGPITTHPSRMWAQRPGRAGAWWLQTWERTSYPTDDQFRSLWLLGKSDPRFLVISLLHKIVSCLRCSAPLQQVEISRAKCLSSSVSWWLRAGHWEVGTSESVSHHCHLFAMWSWAGCLTSLNYFFMFTKGMATAPTSCVCRGFK